MKHINIKELNGRSIIDLLLQEVTLLTSFPIDVLPFGHFIHENDPSFGWYVPYGHFWQEPVARFLNSPDGQTSAIENPKLVDSN